MKKLLFLLALLLTTTVADARRGGDFGLGAVIGSPTGLSFKKWMGSHAVSGALAIGYGWHDRWFHDDMQLYTHVNYLWHNSSAIPVQSGTLPLFWGVGGRLVAGHEFTLGVRGNGGLAYMPATAPIDIYFELGLNVDFIGHVGPDLDAGIGIRYFF